MTRARRAISTGTPVLLVPPAVIGFLFFLLPTLGLLIRAPWSSLGTIYRESDVLDALRVSIVTAVEATVLSVALGIPLAWVLARIRFPGMAMVRAIVTMPLVLPPLVGGVALFLVLGRNGYVGRYLDSWFGIELPFTQHGVVLAQTLVSMPFLVVTLEGAFRSADRGLEEAAATLGATRFRVFSRVTLPLVVPSLVAGMVLCWARALGEFGATILFGGSIRGRTLTMPVDIYVQFQNGNTDAAVALSLVLMLVAVVILGALRDKWLRPVASS